MRKILLFILLCLLTLSIFSGCNAKPVEDNPIFATVRITDENNVLLLNEECKLPSDSNAADALLVTCRAKKLAYQNKNGLYDDFNGIPSEKDKGWLFYFNDKLAEQGLEQTKLANDSENVVEMRYVNFEDAFKNQ